MMSSPQGDGLLPITPARQIIPRTSSASLSDRLLTPEAREKLRDMKRKRSDLSQGSLSSTSDFIEWRSQSLLGDKTILKLARDDLKLQLKSEEKSQARKALLQELEDVENSLGEAEREYLVLEQNKRPLNEEIADAAMTTEAYIEDIYRAWLAASTIGSRELKRVKPDKQDKFKEKVGYYLGAFSNDENELVQSKWCAVQGEWFQGSLVVCAHVVPRSFYRRETDYLFGSDEHPSRSRRNGLFLLKTIETAWDNGMIAIVPDGPVDENPIKYKVIQINPGVSNRLVHQQSNFKERICIKDIDGKKLQWSNENRPARRYMYFRFVMSYIKCQKNGWSTDRFPKGKTWATPQKQGGYIRKGPFKALIRSIGDDVLPDELIEDGTFEEPESELPLKDKVAELGLRQSLKEFEADGDRGLKKDEERHPRMKSYSLSDDEDDSEDDDEEEED